MKIGTVIFGFVFAVMVMTASALHAANQSITATIKFDTPLSQTKVNDIQFGAVKSGQAGTYVLSTANTVTSSNGGVWLYGTPTAGNLTIAGSATQAVTLSTGSYVANGGVAPAAATCKYGAGTAAACDGGLSVAAPGTATTLLLGVTVVADGTQTSGATATPSFTVSVVYN